MYSVNTTVVNPTGIHARPASDFVKKAKEFKARIRVKNLDNALEPNPVNAKSIILVLSIELCLGNNMEISAEGEDEQEAVEALKALVDSGFGEI